MLARPPTRSQVLLPLLLVATLALWSPILAQGPVGTTERVSVAVDGGPGDATSGGLPAVSAGGRYVAFTSAATNLVPDDTNGRIDVFVRDRLLGTTARVSVASDGREARDGDSFRPAMSADGRFVAFTSTASDLAGPPPAFGGVASPLPVAPVWDTNGVADVFLHDRRAGTTERVSVGPGGLEAVGGASDWPAVSDDGRFVAFVSKASNLAPGYPNQHRDVYLHDRQTQITTRVSTPPGVAPPQAPFGFTDSGYPSISGDGRYLAFYSHVANLVSDDANRVADIFVYDRVTGAVALASVDADGTQGDVGSVLPVMSGDGRSLAFTSFATNWVPDTNGVSASDVFRKDLATGALEKVSVADDGSGGDAYAEVYGLSTDGQRVSFMSPATNLVPNDTNDVLDVFVRDLSAGTTVRASVTSDGAQAGGPSTFPALSGDGIVVAFVSSAEDLVAGDTNGVPDVFVRVFSGDASYLGDAGLPS